MGAVVPASLGGRGATEQAIVNIYTSGAGKGGGLFLTALLALCVFFAGQSSITVRHTMKHAPQHAPLNTPIKTADKHITLALKRTLTSGVTLTVLHCSLAFAPLSLSHSQPPTDPQVTSRMAYALAKDGLLPASYARVDPLTNSPTRALALVFVADALVLCLPLLR